MRGGTGRHIFLALLIVAYACGDDESVDPEPDCIPTDCSSMGKNCGPLLDSSGQCLLCGSCSLPETCGGGGTSNVCGCMPKTACVAGDCGDAPDLCGGMLACGDTCVAPLTCGGGGQTNRCGIQVAAGEECDGDSIRCEAGMACCAAVGGAQRCIHEAERGGCPAALPDLVLDQDMLRGSLGTMLYNFAGMPPCVRLGECEFDPESVRMLQFVTSMTNQGTVDMPLPDPTENPGLYAPGELGCTGDRSRFLHYRIRKDASTPPVRQGSLMANCIEDSQKVDPNASSQKKFGCRSNPGLQSGWRYIFMEGLNRDCMSVSLNDIPRDTYLLELEVNADHAIAESDYTNNVITATISF